MVDAQLKMILDALTAMGAGGKEAFIWYMIADRGFVALAWVLCISVIFYGLFKIVDSCNKSEAEQIKIKETARYQR